jgi:large subunit ribosomal protein L5
MSDKEKDKDKEKQKHAKGQGPGAGKPEGKEHKEGHKGEGHKGEGGKGAPHGKGGQRREKKPKESAEKKEEVDDTPEVVAPPARLMIHYKEKVVPALSEKFGFKNALAVPRLEKIVVSMGVGKFATAGGEGKGNVEKAEKELTVIAGQKPVRTKAKKSVANFKVREGMETGLKVTLRGARMYEFLDRLIALAVPRVKDFRGLDPNGFDQSGNYNFGFNEQTVFPEVNSAEVTFQQGMNITMVTTAKNPERGRELLRQFGFPFRDPTVKADGRQ